MTVPSWPGTLPQRVTRQGYSRMDAMKPMTTEMDDGRIVERMSSDVDATIDTVSFWMNATQKAAWSTFYKTDLKRGTLRFTMPTVNDSYGYTTRTVKIVSDRPKEEPQGGGWWKVSFQIKVFF